METTTMGKVSVEATLENLADLYWPVSPSVSVQSAEGVWRRAIARGGDWLPVIDLGSRLDEQTAPFEDTAP